MPYPISVNILARLGVEARRNVEALAFREAIPGTESLKGYCAIAARHLWMMARDLNPVFCCGVFREYLPKKRTYKPISGHCWLELDGYIVDITATQFAGTQTKVFRHFGNKVYVSRADNPHYAISHSGEDAFERVRNWHQQPLDIIATSIFDLTHTLSGKKRKKRAP
jgi:hypothetical protein